MELPGILRDLPDLMHSLQRRGTGQPVTAAQAGAAAMMQITLERAIGCRERMDQVAAPMLAAGLIPALVQIISTSRDVLNLHPAVDTLALLAYRSSQRSDAILAAGAVLPLVQLMRSNDRVDLQHGDTASPAAVDHLQHGATKALARITWAASEREAAQATGEAA